MVRFRMSDSLSVKKHKSYCLLYIIYTFYVVYNPEFFKICMSIFNFNFDWIKNLCGGVLLFWAKEKYRIYSIFE